MKNIVLLFFLLLIIPVISSQAQVLTVVENNRGKKDTISVNSAQIVDINGNLEIGISKDLLMDQIRNDYPSFSSKVEIQSKIAALEKALDNQEVLLNILRENTLKPGDEATFYEGIRGLYSAIQMDSILLDEAIAIEDEWQKEYGANAVNIVNRGKIGSDYYLITNLNKNLSTAKDVLSGIKGQSFDISMVAYIQTKLSDDDRVHIRNFDTFNDRDFYSVPRWVTNLSPSEAEKLNKLKDKADAYNAKAPNYFANFKAEFLQNFPEVDCIIVQKSKLQEFLNDSLIKKDLTKAVIDDIDTVIVKYESIISILKKLEQDVSSWTIDTPFEVIEEAKNLLDIVKSMKVVFENFQESATALAISQLTTKVQTLVGGFTSCYEGLLKAATIVGRSTGILKSQQTSFDSTKQIGDEVLKFSIDDLPAIGFIKLEGAGPRENGDKIEIDLIIRFPDSAGDGISNSSATSEKKDVLESRIFTMQIIGARSEVVAGIILADSFDENGFTPVEDRRFLYAPAVSLLLKFGSRNSNFYNEFVDFGFGLAMSTPDFNTDGTPEFGAGLMVTAFKNILSFGINYNVTLDTPYWSFGINLPFNVPGIPINVPK